MKKKDFLRRISGMLMLSTLVLSACNDANEVKLGQTQSNSAEKIVANTSGISLEKMDLSSTDAIEVANIFINNTNTRGNGNNKVKNVVPILGKDGTPAIYAVNLNNGYVLISATKLLPPILGKVDNGQYNNLHKENGADVVIADLVNVIDQKRQNSEEIDPQQLVNWYPYIASNNPKTFQKTRAMNDPEYWEAFDSWYYSYDTSDRDRCRIFNFYGATSTFTESQWEGIYESYLYDNDPWWNTDYKWENTAYAVRLLPLSI